MAAGCVDILGHGSRPSNRPSLATFVPERLVAWGSDRSRYSQTEIAPPIPRWPKLCAEDLFFSAPRDTVETPSTITSITGVRSAIHHEQAQWAFLASQAFGMSVLSCPDIATCLASSGAGAPLAGHRTHQQPQSCSHDAVEGCRQIVSETKTNRSR